MNASATLSGPRTRHEGDEPNLSRLLPVQLTFSRRRRCSPSAVTSPSGCGKEHCGRGASRRFLGGDRRVAFGEIRSVYALV
jgi:hypothetical protein